MTLVLEHLKNRGLSTTQTKIFVKQCCHPGFLIIVLLGLIKEDVEFASFADATSIWKFLKKLPLSILKAVMLL